MDKETIENHGASSAYIDRTLVVEGQSVDQDELLKMSGVVVVLGEPGVGKSELLDYVSAKVGVSREDARIFIHDDDLRSRRGGYLIVDAIDEISMEHSAESVDKLLVDASKTSPKVFLLSSRSAHWDESRKLFVEKVFKHTPKIVHLCPLNENEQETLFEHFLPEQKFEDFKYALHDVGLDGLLGNPHNLRLIAKVYQHRHGHIESKNSIYADSIEILLSERENRPANRSRPSTSTLVNIGDDVCAKLFLAGCVGLSLSESNSSGQFPFFRDLCNREEIQYLIGSGLFIASRHGSDYHELIHRTVVEYCAARYLARIVQDPSRRYTLQRALALIAPNGYVREDLRGLLGWFGCMLIDSVDQKAVIKIDPVSVLVNGDPTQLRESSKLFLLDQMYELTKQDPSLLGGAMWDSLKTKGFTSTSVLSEIQRIIMLPDANGTLKVMLIRLLDDVECTEEVSIFLGRLASDKKQSRYVRLSSFEVGNFDTEKYFEIFDFMLEDADEESLNIVLSSMDERRVNELDQRALLKIYLLFADSYTARHGDRGSLYVSSKLAFRSLLETLSLQRAIDSLNALTKCITCVCEAKNVHQCVCKIAKSVVGSMVLDRVLNDQSYTPDANQIWQWIKPMQFDFAHSRSRGESTVLRENHQLRNSIQYIAMEETGEAEKIRDLRVYLSGHGHRDLFIAYTDVSALLMTAFENTNVPVWSALHHGHIFSNSEQADKYDHNRNLMKQHANENLLFMAAWMHLERNSRLLNKRMDDNYARKDRRWIRRRQRTDEQQKREIQSDFDSQKQSILDGEHKGWLFHLARLYLRGESRTLEHIEMPNESFVSTALRNSLRHLKVPTLEEVASGDAENKTRHTVIIAHAACLAEFTCEGNLDGVEPAVLAVVKTQGSTSYGNKPSWEFLEKFQQEINRVIFAGPTESERYARSYVESRLKRNVEHIPLHWFSHEVAFETLLPTLPFEWLEKYPEASTHVTQELFNIAIRHGEFDELQGLVRLRAEATCSNKDHPLRDFWHLMNFVYENQISDLSKSWLREHKERLLHIHGYFDELRYHPEDKHALSAEKIELIFDTYIDDWPEVKLRDHWGTLDPPGHTAYRFLANDLPWRLLTADTDQVVQLIDRLIRDRRFAHLKLTFQSVRARKISRSAHGDQKKPQALEIVKALEDDGLASVEDLRIFFCEKIHELQSQIYGSETDVRSIFYEGAKHVPETVASQRIVTQLKPQLQSLGIVAELEDQMADLNRCDITLQYPIQGRNVLLVVEVKGQWHKDLYTAASEQLEKRYMNHPDAENQGVYLVLWYGPSENVAGKKNKDLKTSDELRDSILNHMTEELRARIEVVVLDFAKISDGRGRKKSKATAKKKSKATAKKKSRATAKSKSRAL